MREHSLGLRKTIDFVADVRHFLRRHDRFLWIGSRRRADETDGGLTVEKDFFHKVSPGQIVERAGIAGELRD